MNAALFKCDKAAGMLPLSGKGAPRPAVQSGMSEKYKRSGTINMVIILKIIDGISFLENK